MGNYTIAEQAWESSQKQGKRSASMKKRSKFGEEQQKLERLENAILKFIERTVDKPLLEGDTEILPAMVHELVELWKI